MSPDDVQTIKMRAKARALGRPTIRETQVMRAPAPAPAPPNGTTELLMWLGFGFLLGASWAVIMIVAALWWLS